MTSIIIKRKNITFLSPAVKENPNLDNKNIYLSKLSSVIKNNNINDFHFEDYKANMGKSKKEDLKDYILTFIFKLIREHLLNDTKKSDLLKQTLFIPIKNNKTKQHDFYITIKIQGYEDIELEIYKNKRQIGQLYYKKYQGMTDSSDLDWVVWMPTVYDNLKSEPYSEDEKKHNTLFMNYLINLIIEKQGEVSLSF